MILLYQLYRIFLQKNVFVGKNAGFFGMHCIYLFCAGFRVLLFATWGPSIIYKLYFV